MTLEKLIANIQSKLGIAKGEITVLSLVVLGLAIGLIVSEKNSEDYDVLAQKLDSLADARQTTYTGIDNEGNVDKELAKADTVVNKKKLFEEIEKEDKGLIDINIASKVELMDLPGVGEKTAEKIINYREKQPFEKKEDLKKIKGIGPKKLEKMKDKIIINQE